MDGILTESVTFNDLTFEPGTRIRIDPTQAQLLNNMSATDSLIVSICMDYFTIKALVQKSKVRVALT